MCLHDAKTKLAIESTLTTFNVVFAIGKSKEGRRENARRRCEDIQRGEDRRRPGEARVKPGPEAEMTR